MLVQLNKCVGVCGSDLKRGKVGMGVYFRRFCFNMRVVWDICLFCFGPEYDGLLWGVMYGEWYGVCDFVVLSVDEVCVDYGGVNVFHVCLDFGVVYGVGVFVLSVMRVVGRVPLWVVCVSSCR